MCLFPDSVAGSTGLSPKSGPQEGPVLLSAPTCHQLHGWSLFALMPDHLMSPLVCVLPDCSQ